MRSYYNIYTRYSKEDILDFLDKPESNYTALRHASIYLYNLSSHYRRLILYFAEMPTYDYYLTPLKLDTSKKINSKTLRSAFKKASDTIELMNLKHELIKVAITCFREDVFYGYEYETKDSYTLKKLPPDYCRICAIEDGVYTFEFDFSYFSSREELLELYGPEFNTKYQEYKNNRSGKRWQELNTKKAVCIKLNEDLTYPIPPFAGTFPDIYDIADYKELMKAKTEIGNYKMLFMKMPFENGRFKIPQPIAEDYYHQVAEQLPEQIGLGMAPMELEDFDFEKSGSTADTDEVVKSESSFWSASGASAAILGKADITTKGALELSIETDAAIVYGFLRQIERWLNRKLKQLAGTIHFKINFLNATIYNRTTVQDQMLKASQYSFPTKYMTAAAYGLSQSDFEGLLVLENDVMDLAERMTPVTSTHTQNGTSTEPTESAGRPEQDEVSDEGEATREGEKNNR